MQCYDCIDMTFDQIQPHQREPDDSIVDEVLKNAKTIVLNEDFPKGADIVCFEYGSKKLQLGIMKEARLIGTRLDTVEGSQEKPWETNIIYKAAKQYMQRVVDEQRVASTYRLRTRNENMLNWAHGPGAELFKWHNIHPGVPGSREPLTVFDALISPTARQTETPNR